MDAQDALLAPTEENAKDGNDPDRQGRGGAVGGGDDYDKEGADPRSQERPPSTKPIGDEVVELLWALVDDLSTDILVGFGSFLPTSTQRQAQSCGSSVAQTNADWGGYCVGSVRQT